MRNYRIIESVRCACRVCCGENLTDPEITEATNLEEALEIFNSAWMPGWSNGETTVQASSEPFQGEGWITKTGCFYDDSFSALCPNEDHTGPFHWELSLHFPDRIKKNTKIRAYKRAERGY